MERVILKARAKINWTLDVVGKRPDGYHEIETVMQSIDLYDRVVLKKNKSGIYLEHDNSYSIPSDSRNIAWKAAEIVRKKFNINTGVKIIISKRIPVAAGLAGGSANAAAVLKGLNCLWGLGMDEQEMREIGKELGADVPFCIKGGSSLARGIGEKLTPFEVKRPIWLLVVNPPIKISTRKMFNLWGERSMLAVKRPDAARMIEALSSGDIRRVADSMGNVLELVTASIYPEILELKQELIGCGALNSVMSGGGPSVYGIFEDGLKAREAAELLKGIRGRFFVTSTSDRGIEYLGES